MDYEDENPNLVFYSYSESLQSVENKRWSVADTFALIAAYNKYRNQFVFAKRRKEVWELITEFLKSNGINVRCFLFFLILNECLIFCSIRVRMYKINGRI